MTTKHRVTAHDLRHMIPAFFMVGVAVGYLIARFT